MNVGMLVGKGHRSVLIVGLVRSLLSMLFLSVNHMISKGMSFFGLLESGSFFWMILKLFFAVAVLIKLSFA